ncbi:MAG: LamG domain-containing protein, partial [Nanoarchaeota archaeon]
NIDGLVSWWRMEGNADDEMGKNDGTLNNEVDCNAEGKYGKACKFDGDGDYISVPHHTSFVMTEGISIVTWAKTPLTNNWSGIVDKFGEAYPFENFGYKLGTNNKDTGFRFDIGNGTPTTGYTSRATLVNIEDNSWHFVASTYDGSTLKIYDNGEEHTTLGDQIGFLTSYPASLWIGTSHYRPDQRSFNGTIDEIMIFNKALNEDEIKAIYELDLS